MRTIPAAVAASLLLTLPAPLLAQDGLIDVADGGDTAWLLTATLLALMATLPGLALLHGGQARSGNVLSAILQCAGIAAAVSLLWILAGYTLAFGDVSGGWIGAGNAWMLIEIGNVRAGTATPESVFVLFQMAFAILTPALMAGAWMGRARFGWVMGFCALWSLAVYAPVAHWLRGGGWLAARLGALDFAGGLVVSTTAGVSALVIALLLGRRQGFPGTIAPPSSPPLAMAGAGLIWLGWLALNGGSAFAANDDAGAAIVNTHVAASAAALVWLAIERFRRGKSTALGFATGAVAGLAAVAPASGFISPGAAMILGIVAAVACFSMIQVVRNRLEIDDSLDVFAVYGVGGAIGVLLLAVFMAPAFGGTGYPQGMGMASQFMAQAVALGVVALWSAVASAILAILVSLAFPMRVSEDEEREGLDVFCHDASTGETD